MIVGIIALISSLFFGNVDLLYVDQLEKGVKKNVDEKERRKEILAEIKRAESVIADFEKVRKALYKDFKKIVLDKDVNNDSLNEFFVKVHQERKQFYSVLIDSRLSIQSKIKDEEWMSIIERSYKVTAKRIKKNKNESVKYKKTKSAIVKYIDSEDQVEDLLMLLNSAEKQNMDLLQKVKELNVLQNEIISSRISTKQDLISAFKSQEDVRTVMINQINDFRNAMMEIGSEKAWNKVMNAFIKDLVVTPTR